MQGNVDSDVGKWLLCRLMLRQGYSETDVAEQMKSGRPPCVEFPGFRGEESTKFLYDFMDELEEQRNGELTEKQIMALIKVAKGLISSIEAK
jgi:hypothetical protein